MGTIVLDCYTFLLVVGVMTGLLEMITGIIGIVKVSETGNATLSTCNCIDDVNSLFAVACLSSIIILFGLLAIIAPFKPVLIVNYIFLWNYLNYGCFLIIVGIMCLGIAGDLGIACGVISMVIGLVHIVVHFLLGDKREVVTTTTTTTTTIVNT